MEDMQRIFAKTEHHVNYASVAEHRVAVQAELERLTTKGFMTKVEDWRSLKREFKEVVVNKMACITKLKEDGSVKLRLITDMLRSEVNKFVRLSERIVLPRLCDIVEAALAMTEFLPEGDEEQDIEMMISDFADAFHSMGVLAEERPNQIVAGMSGDFGIYETVVFGGGGSPLI